MPDTDTASVPTGLNVRPLLIAAVLFGALVAATLALWTHYGTAVFYEMILAGIAACF